MQVIVEYADHQAGSTFPEKDEIQSIYIISDKPWRMLQSHVDDKENGKYGVMFTKIENDEGCRSCDKPCQESKQIDICNELGHSWARMPQENQYCYRCGAFEKIKGNN